MPHPPAPMPRSHLLVYCGTVPGHVRQGHLVLRLGLGSGSLKSVVRACFLLPQSRAPLLFSSAPAVLPPSSTTRHDTTSLQPTPGLEGVLLINDHLAARLPLHCSDVVNSRRWSSPSHALREKTLDKSPRSDRNPTQTQLQTHHDRRWSDSTIVTRTGASLKELATHDSFKQQQL